jgi:uncharacterized protein (TIGR02246 family)
MIPSPTNPEDRDVISLYKQLHNCWNDRDAPGMAGLFAEDGHVVGFDGSQIDGRDNIAGEMARIFASHMTAAYVGIVREVRFLSPEIALLRAVAGMVPRGQQEINPAVNAIQTLVAEKQAGRWRAVLYQNTPAQFHGRPELSAALTEELRAALKTSGS